jgi:hypothetical protein
MNENTVACRLVARQRPRNNIRCTVVASNGECSTASAFTKYPRSSASHNNYVPSVLSLTHQPTKLNSTDSHNSPTYSSARPHRKRHSSVAVPFLHSCVLGFILLLYLIIAVETCFLAEPLLSDGCRVFAYSAVFV